MLSTFAVGGVAALYMLIEDTVYQPSSGNNGKDRDQLLGGNKGQYV
jgi:hypothetical protein